MKRGRDGEWSSSKAGCCGMQIGRTKVSSGGPENEIFRSREEESDRWHGGFENGVAGNETLAL